MIDPTVMSIVDIVTCLRTQIGGPLAHEAANRIEYLQEQYTKRGPAALNIGEPSQPEMPVYGSVEALNRLIDMARNMNAANNMILQLQEQLKKQGAQNEDKATGQKPQAQSAADTDTAVGDTDHGV